MLQVKIIAHTFSCRNICSLSLLYVNILYFHIVISGCLVIIRAHYLLQILKAPLVTYIGNPNVCCNCWSTARILLNFMAQLCSASHCRITITVSSQRTSADDDPLSPRSYVLSRQHCNMPCKLLVREHPSVISVITTYDYSITTHWCSSMSDLSLPLLSSIQHVIVINIDQHS